MTDRPTVVYGFLEGKSDWDFSEHWVLQGIEHPVTVRVNTRGIDETAKFAFSFQSKSFNLGSCCNSLLLFLQTKSFNLGSCFGNLGKTNSFLLSESQFFGQFLRHSLLFSETSSCFFGEANSFCGIG